jgi:hypothetical protein
VSEWRDNPRFRAVLDNATFLGLFAAATEIQKVMKFLLSRAGTGDVYALRRAAETEQKRRKKDFIGPMKKSGWFTFNKAPVETAQRLGIRLNRLGMPSNPADRRKLLRYAEGRRLGLRGLGFHRASRPGQPPAKQTGRLSQSWQTATKNPSRAGEVRKVRFGSNVKYAPYLEYGTDIMKPRPYVGVSVAEARAKATDAFRRFFRRGMRSLGGKP